MLHHDHITKPIKINDGIGLISMEEALTLAFFLGITMKRSIHEAPS